MCLRRIKMSKYILIFSMLCLFLVTPLCHAGLIGYWPFDKDDIAGDKAIDRSGKGNDGVISGAVPAGGRTGQALKFNGSGNSYVYIEGLTVRSPQLSASL